MSPLGKGSRLGYRGLAAILVTITMTLLGLAVGSASASPSAKAGANKSGGMSPVVAHNDQGMMKAPVTGTTEDGRKVKGSFTPSEFTAVNDTLMVTGTLEGKILGKGKPKSFSKEITTQVQDATTGGASGAKFAGAADGACDILNLVLGPLDLDLLGLQVHLNQVVLDIVAQSGAGNLLGNLLCSVAGLLDGAGAGGLGGIVGDLLDNLTGLLNDILGVLNL